MNNTYFYTFIICSFFGASLICHGNLNAYQTTYNGDASSSDASLATEQFVPENEIERLIVQDPEWSKGAKWGKPRNGHPEGAIIFHIQEVLNNVEQVSANSEERQQLRLIALVHDTFKFKVDRTQTETGENHHATIARRFAERYIDETNLLEIIELHDEAYNAWTKGNRNHDWNRAHQHAEELIERLGPNLDLYLKFYLCDISTGDKIFEPYTWFDQITKER